VRVIRFRLWPILLATVLLVAGGPHLAAVGAEPRSRAQAFAHAFQIHRQNSERLLSLNDVVGTATGVDRNGKFAVKVFTRRAGVAGIPKKLDDVPVVVEATGEFFALQRPLRRAPDPHGNRRPPGRLRDQRPTVSIISPKEGEIVSGEIVITAFAVDDRGLAGVRFFVDGAPLGFGVNGADGWSVAWDTTQVGDGQHTITATATDSSGQTGSDSANVMVDNVPGPFSPDGRPAPIGVSTGNENERSAGTIACRVKDAQGNVYVLSNNHVYARTNKARPGERIVQPGMFDTAGKLVYSDQVIGVLADFVPIDFSGRGSNTVDAAIALSTIDDQGTSTPEGGYGTPKSTPTDPYVGQPVRKYGRTTFLTSGTVSGVDATVIVHYGSRNARFTGQIIVTGEGFIDAGDSGSLLVSGAPDEAGHPVGLLFAGNSDGSMAIANPIQAVLDAFSVTVDGE
jgi:hypothetical protein